MEALTYLHGNGIIHRDIKAANILITAEGSIKVGDFGVASQVLSNLRRNSFVGSPYWMAPEVIKRSTYDSKADIWSLGITLVEMLTGEPPLAHIEPSRAIFIIPKNAPPRLHPSFSDALRDLVALCLHDDPQQRPSARDLLGHPIFRHHHQKGSALASPLVTTLDRYRAAALQDSSPPHCRGSVESPPEALPTESKRHQFIAEWDFEDASPLRVREEVSALPLEDATGATTAQSVADFYSQAAEGPAGALHITPDSFLVYSPPQEDEGDANGCNRDERGVNGCDLDELSYSDDKGASDGARDDDGAYFDRICQQTRGLSLDNTSADVPCTEAVALRQAAQDDRHLGEEGAKVGPRMQSSRTQSSLTQSCSTQSCSTQSCSTQSSSTQSCNSAASKEPPSSAPCHGLSHHRQLSMLSLQSSKGTLDPVDWLALLERSTFRSWLQSTFMHEWPWPASGAGGNVFALYKAMTSLKQASLSLLPLSRPNALSLTVAASVRGHRAYAQRHLATISEATALLAEALSPPNADAPCRGIDEHAPSKA